MIKRFLFLIIPTIFMGNVLRAQIVINEGSNRNYSSIADENGEYPDWIELYNNSDDSVSLFNYSLSDDSLQPAQWTFPNVGLKAHEYRTVFCSAKDRKPVSGFVNVLNTGTYNPHTGWNIHELSTPFYWDGISNILINTCSYSSVGYTVNSVFNQTATNFYSTSFAFQDGSPASCSATYGNRVMQRPNMKFNGHVVGTGSIQNSPYDYPAPYGNWYWGARHQMLIHASELADAGLSAGNINSLAFDVVWTEPGTVYDYFEVYMRLVSYDELTSEFEPADTNNFLHTNFKVDKDGETVRLYSEDQTELSSLFVNCSDLDNSRGSHPDASPEIFLFREGTPSATNNHSNTYTEYLLPPTFSVPSGFFDDAVDVYMENPNTAPSSIHYTIDGSEPSILSPIYNGEPVHIQYSCVLKARAFTMDILPSPITASSYLFGVEHNTPVLSVITDNRNLYGENGIFDNWWYDWQRAAYVEYFDSLQNLVFSQRAGIQIDGGWGGARGNPQHSFRVELENSVLGDGPIDYQLIPDRPNRTKYSKFYLRNGSNQYLVIPYKDACEVTGMGKGLNNYYSAYRPVSVYINGYYYGLYELREKFDAEYFKTLEGADKDEVDILSVSAWYGYAMRAVEGSSATFWNDYNAFNMLDPADTSFWNQADQIFDMTYYNDYIIGESWIANTDWPYNNIKIYRSDKSNYRWRFCLVDLELSLQPNGWTDCYFDHIQYMMTYDANNAYVHIWQKGIQNDRFRNYFINRFADVMNTNYRLDRISAIENNLYNLTVVEMQNEYARWGDPNHIPEQMADFTANHQALQSQLAERTTQVRNHMLTNFNLPNLVDVTLDVYPEGAGTIHISTIAPDEYPWQGVYFNGVPVKIEAIANEDYSFLNWGENGLIADTLNPVFLDTLNTTSVSFDAYFEYLATDIAKIEKQSYFILYPNPASDFVLIRSSLPFGKDATYQVMDIEGRSIVKGTLTNEKKEARINVSMLPSSIYIIKINEPDKNTQVLRFVKF